MYELHGSHAALFFQLQSNKDIWFQGPSSIRDQSLNKFDLLVETEIVICQSKTELSIDTEDFEHRRIQQLATIQTFWASNIYGLQHLQVESWVAPYKQEITRAHENTKQ